MTNPLKVVPLLQIELQLQGHHQVITCKDPSQLKVARKDIPQWDIDYFQDKGLLDCFLPVKENHFEWYHQGLIGRYVACGNGGSFVAMGDSQEEVTEKASTAKATGLLIKRVGCFSRTYLNTVTSTTGYLYNLYELLEPPVPAITLTASDYLTVTADVFPVTLG